MNTYSAGDGYGGESDEDRTKRRRQGAGGCFIATTFDHTITTQVIALRQFRDVVMKHDPFGRFLIQAYYQASPALAAWIATRPRARTALRRTLCALM